MTNRQVLLLIAAFVTLTLGSFIWYIATWDSAARTSLIPTEEPLFILAQNFSPGAPALTTGTTL